MRKARRPFSSLAALVVASLITMLTVGVGVLDPRDSIRGFVGAEAGDEVGTTTLDTEDPAQSVPWDEDQTSPAGASDAAPDAKTRVRSERGNRPGRTSGTRPRDTRPSVTWPTSSWTPRATRTPRQHPGRPGKPGKPGQTTTPAEPSKPSNTAKPTPTERPSTPAPTTTSAPSPTTPAAGDPAMENEVVRLVNARRAEAGCEPVRADARLVGAARGHSTDMAVNDYFDHTGRDGRSPWDRAKAAGYDSASGENIAMGQSSAAAVMDSWMNSEGHRANILNCDSKAIGVGVARNSSGAPYWTQMFGTA